jgi:hypothetical protein
MELNQLAVLYEYANNTDVRFRDGVEERGKSGSEWEIGDISIHSSVLAHPDLIQIFAANCGGALASISRDSTSHICNNVFHTCNSLGSPPCVAEPSMLRILTNRRPSAPLPAPAQLALSPPHASSHPSKPDSCPMKSAPPSTAPSPHRP